MSDLNWLDKKPTSRMERLLEPSLRSLDAKKQPFVVIDGGDTFSRPSPSDPSIKVLQRDYESFVSGTETINGEKVAIERTSSASTSSNFVYAQPFAPTGYIYKSYLHFSSPERQFIVCQDLNSYRNCLKQGTADDKKDLSHTLAFSMEPLRVTKQIVDREIPTLPGLTICAWGKPLAEAPNMISFPTEGVAVHYRLQVSDSGTRATLVSYLRAPTSDAG